MISKNCRLGLHTSVEQAQAFESAEAAFRAAMKAQEDRDERAYQYARGYLQAIMDLASMEGAGRLAEDVLELIQVLEANIPS